MASYSKLPLLLATALFYDRSLIPPTLPPSSDEQKRTKIHGHRSMDWYEGIVIPIIPLWTRLSYWAFTVTEAAVLITGRLDTYRPAEVTKLIGPYNFVGRITVAFVLGASLIITGAMIRFRCFREMGRHFTFALSLRDNHTLITTGPYAIVRHPAYTGGNMTILGAVLTLMHDGSWWFSGGYTTGWGQFLALNFIASALLIVRGFLRGHKEDSYLKISFGEQWERFAQQVPHRYIPGVC
ncbi:hypothetical protein C8J57DRAFT_1445186 [Mycena rebaudengoi]|nr:hypothetical protein C8J57DRAFT_1445186 [Mycena rebaudengoi]